MIIIYIYLFSRYVSDYVCTDTEYSAKILRESRQSFLSGHAAFSMYGAIFTSVGIIRVSMIMSSNVVKPIV